MRRYSCVGRAKKPMEVLLALVVSALCVVAVRAAPIDPAMPPPADWQIITHEKLGFEISYPGNVFKPVGDVASDAGRVLASRDGSAKLLIAAFDNDTDISLSDYRQHVLATSYPGAAIDYAPVRRNWFVLSGLRDGKMFYERVSFTCNGRRITSWAMLYPAEQRSYYDRVLEAIARTFKPSRNAAEGC